MNKIVDGYVIVMKDSFKYFNSLNHGSLPMMHQKNYVQLKNSDITLKINGKQEGPRK